MSLRFCLLFLVGLLHVALAQTAPPYPIQLSLPSGWLFVPAEQGFGKRIAPPDSQALILLFPAESMEAGMEPFLENFLAELEGEMSPLGGTPLEKFQTSGGLSGVSQARFSRNPEGKELYSMLFVLQVEGGGQALYVAAPSEDEFKKVALPLAKAVKGARLVGETAALSSQTAAVDFALDWTRRLDLESAPLDIARALPEESLLAFSGSPDPAQQAAILKVAKSEATPPTTDISLEAAVGALQSKPDALPEAWTADRVTALQMDSQANLALGVSGPGGHAFVGRKAKSQNLEVVATPKFVAEVAAQVGENFAVKFRLAPLGEAWLLLYDKSQASYDLDSSLRLYRMQRTAEGNWRPFRVVLQAGAQGSGYKAPSQFDFAKFGADWNGGLVFATEDALWRMDPQGRLSSLGKLDPSLLGRLGPEPVIQRNGDVWFWGKAATSDTEFSELLRLRLRQGQLQVARIEALMLSGIMAVGEPLSGVLLRLDYSHGGLLGFDTRHGLLFSILPKN